MKRNRATNKIILMLIMINLALLPANAIDNPIDNKTIGNENIVANNFNKVTPITNNLLNNKYEKIALLVTKYSPDFRYSSESCSSSQCYNGSTCINNAKYIGDNYCNNGNWTTRTKLLALELLNLTSNSPNNYSLFCDDYNKSINYGAYGIPISGINFGNNTEKFCVLTYYPSGAEKVIIGAVLKNAITDNQDIFTAIGKPGNYCLPIALGEDGIYRECNNQDVWYNNLTNTLIFSGSDIDLRIQPKFMNHPFIQALLQPITEILGIAPFNDSWINEITPLIENTSYFNKIFILQKGQKRIFAVLEEGKYKNTSTAYNYLTINYENFFSDICLSANQYKTDTEYARCEQIGLSNFLITRKQSTAPQSKTLAAWPQLTAQIRAKDVPDMWPPKIKKSWIEPLRGYQGTTFTILTEISDPSGVEIANATIRNSTNIIANIVLVNTSDKIFSNWTAQWASSLSNLAGNYLVDIYAEDSSSNPSTQASAAAFQIITRPLCVIESSACTASTIPIFSLSSEVDAHVAKDSNYFINYKMCCLPEIGAVDFKDSCNASETPFNFSISGNLATEGNDQHIGDYSAFNNFKACLSGSVINSCSIITQFCPVSTDCILTMSSPNGGHAAGCDIFGSGGIEYPYRLCCTRS